MSCSTCRPPASVAAWRSGVSSPSSRSDVFNQSRAAVASPAISSRARTARRASRTTWSDSVGVRRPLRRRRPRIVAGIPTASATSCRGAPAASIKFSRAMNGKPLRTKPSVLLDCTSSGTAVPDVSRDTIARSRAATSRSIAGTQESLPKRALDLLYLAGAFARHRDLISHLYMREVPYRQQTSGVSRTTRLIASAWVNARPQKRQGRAGASTGAPPRVISNLVPLI